MSFETFWGELLQVIFEVINNFHGPLAEHLFTLLAVVGRLESQMHRRPHIGIVPSLRLYNKSPGPHMQCSWIWIRKSPFVNAKDFFHENFMNALLNLNASM